MAKKNIEKEIKKKLKVYVTVSWYVNALIAELHNNYPNTERSGIGRIEKRDGYYEVTDIRFPKQDNSSGETEIKDGGLDDLLEDIFNNNPEQLHERKCWIHSHHTMWCFWSHTDQVAKNSFNDGNLNCRWSIVTAYTDSWNITYKCALNIFKPILAEFDVPVKKEAFDMQWYIKTMWIDYDTYMANYDAIETRRDEALYGIMLWHDATDEDINGLLDIFNVENNEDNVSVCKDLLDKQIKKQIDKAIEIANDEFDKEQEELSEMFGANIFDAKLKELKDNIIPPKTYAWSGYKPAIGFDVNKWYNPNDWYPTHKSKQQSVLDEYDDDIKYNNHTNKKTTSFKNYPDYYDPEDRMYD